MNFASLSPDWKLRFQRWKTELRTCLRCHAHYYEISNIGNFECSQHAESADRSGIYRCCNVEERTVIGGCVPCDHTQVPAGWTDDDFVDLPDVLMDIINPKSESMEYEGVGVEEVQDQFYLTAQTTRVWRYNRVTTHQRSVLFYHPNADKLLPPLPSKRFGTTPNASFVG